MVFSSQNTHISKISVLRSNTHDFEADDKDIEKNICGPEFVKYEGHFFQKLKIRAVFFTKSRFVRKFHISSTKFSSLLVSVANKHISARKNVAERALNGAKGIISYE